MKMQQLPSPSFYEARDAHDAAHHVANALDLQVAAAEWRRRFQLTPAGADLAKIALLIIDQQKDFASQEGTLFVAGHSGVGAMEDQRRLVEFIYRNLRYITDITCSMDSHLPFQIFYPSAHLRQDGSHPDPFTVITAEEYRAGVYRANPDFAAQIGADPVWLQRQFIYYCEQLEAQKRLELTIWAYHTLIGSHGHTLSGVVDEARLFHGFARGAANIPAIKGGNPLTEHYSIFRPEVMTTFDGKPIPGVQKNTRLIETLLKNDVVVIAGEAASHCVAWTIEDLLGEIRAQDPKLAEKVYIMEDCTSPVVIPGVVDYTPQAQDALDRFRNAGMHVVKSTDPIETWPGIKLAA